MDVTRDTGFAGVVQLALEGTPAGVTGVFTPNPVSSSPNLASMDLAIPLTADAGVSMATARAPRPRQHFEIIEVSRCTAT